ncbi:MAG: hypothetical protein IJ131_09650 [Eggerthellaceae bacterium]|nr:hypothetical protein [Eggerthellaceae bacterium]
MRAVRRWFRKQLGRIPLYDDVAERIKVQEAADMIAIEYLEGLVGSGESKYPPDQVTKMLFQYQRSYQRSQGRRPSITSYTRTFDDLSDIQRTAFGFELEEIRAAYDEGIIGRRTYATMRDNVRLMLVDLDADLELA